MPEFQCGDVVVCITPFRSVYGALTKGASYVVLEVHSDPDGRHTIRFTGDDGKVYSGFAHRFIHAYGVMPASTNAGAEEYEEIMQIQDSLDLANLQG